MLNIKAGDTVWFHNFDGVNSGVVIDIMKGSIGTNKVACVKCRDTFKTLDVDSRKLWMTQQEATLALAETKQQEAARLLSSAADLFKRAGGMTDDVAEPAEAS